MKDCDYCGKRFDDELNWACCPHPPMSEPMPSARGFRLAQPTDVLAEVAGFVANHPWAFAAAAFAAISSREIVALVRLLFGGWFS